MAYSLHKAPLHPGGCSGHHGRGLPLPATPEPGTVAVDESTGVVCWWRSTDYRWVGCESLELALDLARVDREAGRLALRTLVGAVVTDEAARSLLSLERGLGSLERARAELARRALGAHFTDDRRDGREDWRLPKPNRYRIVVTWSGETPTIWGLRNR